MYAVLYLGGIVLKIKHIILACVILFFPIIVITAIYIFYPDNYKAWDFWTNYMIYFGTVLLGIVSLYQNITLNNENRKIRIPEKITLLPFVKYTPKFYTGPPTEYNGLSIEFEDGKRIEDYMVLHGPISNISKYTIIKAEGCITNDREGMTEVKNYHARNFILESGESQEFTLKICILHGMPTQYITERNEVTGEAESRCYYDYDLFHYLIDDKVKINITFTNIFGLKTRGSISFVEGYYEEIIPFFEMDLISIE